MNKEGRSMIKWGWNNQTPKSQQKTSRELDRRRRKIKLNTLNNRQLNSSKGSKTSIHLKNLKKPKNNSKGLKKKWRTTRRRKILTKHSKRPKSLTRPRPMKRLRMLLLKLEAISRSKLRNWKSNMGSLRKMEDRGKRLTVARSHLFLSISPFSILKTKSSW